MAGGRPPRKGVGKSIILGAVFVAALLALVIYASSGLGRHACEVCLDFEGRTACRKAEGNTVEEARRTATDLACAMLSSGMTESLRCSNTPPSSVTCDGTRAPVTGGPY